MQIKVTFLIVEARLIYITERKINKYKLYNCCKKILNHKFWVRLENNFAATKYSFLTK